MTTAIDALAATPARLAGALGRLDSVAAVRTPPQGGWSLADVIGHVRAADAITAPRVLHLLVDSVRRPFATYDERAWQHVLARAGRTPQAALAIFAAQRDELVALLRTLSEAEWALAAVHPQHGLMSIARIVTTMAGHEDEHCLQAGEIAAWLSMPTVG